MGAFYTPGMDYDLNTYTDNLGAYTVDEGAIDTLELARQLIESGKYYHLGVPFPGISSINFAAQDTLTGNITVPPLSYLVSITGDIFYSSGGSKGTRANEGFQFRIYDKGAKMDTFLTTYFGSSKPNAGLMIHRSAPNSSSDHPVGPYFLKSPMVVLAPGALQISVTNLATQPCWIQLLFQFAVPVSRLSANEMLIKGGR